MNQLISLGVVPIVNENDMVSTEELSGEAFGDNDKLSAFVASKMDADLLIMLSDIDGLYTKNPKLHKDAHLVKTITKVTKDVKNMCFGKGCLRAVGGMLSKVKAAEIAMQAGVSLIIVNGRVKDVVRKVIDGEEIGTLFLSVSL